MTTAGLVLAAPASGCGKTLITLAILAALKRRGAPVRAAKAGPDYIDPGFHAAALGTQSVNLDLWAMGADGVRTLAAETGRDGSILIIEGVMGLFDGAAQPAGDAADRRGGSTADLAATLGLPVVLIVDAARQSQSVAALVHGFNTFRPEQGVDAVILNRVGSPRHAALLAAALEPLGLPVLGSLPHSADLVVPSRHLGLIQAEEHPDIARFLAAAADLAEAHVDLSGLQKLARPATPPASWRQPGPPPLGQRIAVANDRAFRFAYPHMLSGWRAAGSEIVPFSPLADEVPDPSASAIFLPGGYPELHAGALADAGRFKAGMRSAAARGTVIYGECGGYMVLGAGLIDGAGQRHAMLDLLPVETSFARPRRHLGYRLLRPTGRGPWPSRAMRGHEFHYAETVGTPPNPLFAAADATGTDLGAVGSASGSVSGSFCHIIACQ